MAYGQGKGLTSASVDISGGIGTYLITVWSNYPNAANQYVLGASGSGQGKIYNLVNNTSNISAEYDSETKKLKIYRGVGDMWGYVVEKLSPYVNNSAVVV